MKVGELLLPAVPQRVGRRARKRNFGRGAAREKGERVVATSPLTGEVGGWEVATAVAALMCIAVTPWPQVAAVSHRKRIEQIAKKIPAADLSMSSPRSSRQSSK
jgi:hypothetical protein